MFAYGIPGHQTHREIAAPARAALSDVVVGSLRWPRSVGGRLFFPARPECQSRHGCELFASGRVDAREFKVHC